MNRLIVLAATVLFTGRLAAQDSTACTFDTAAHTFLDSVTIGLAPGRPPKDRDHPDVRADYLAAGQAIRTYFHPPAQVRLPLWARTVSRRASHGGSSPEDTTHTRYVSYGLRGHIRFRLDPTGRLADSQIVVDNASPDITANIVAAVKRADSAYAFSPPSKQVLRDQGIIRLQFVELLPWTRDPSIPLMRLVVPDVFIDSEPDILSFPRLEYPSILREEGISGRVLLEFVVGADGRVEISSIDLVQAEYRDFAVESIESLERARFRPARIEHCAVPALVRMPVDFKIRRSQ